MPDASLPSTVQPPSIAWADPDAATPAALAALPCPNCGSGGLKPLVLTVDVQLPDNPTKRLHLMRCPACTCRFYDDQVAPDYAEPALNDRGRVPFYVQQGAGVSLITRPLAQVGAAPGKTYMEIGCGYGFGLDFALHTLGWQGAGIDPAPLAALGRDALDLPIELRYLRDDNEAHGTIDVVMGSEVIEHVPSPAAFVRTLRTMLRPGGLLVLTTPNGDDVDRGSPQGVIVPLLSPSLHLVIQTSASLTALLRAGGFAHVEVATDSHSLVAFASDAPLRLDRDHDRLRVAYRAHLLGRAAVLDPASDVFLGFAGRAFQESVNDGDMAAADRAWALLRPACQDRYGFDLDKLNTLPGAVATCRLDEMARIVPLNLGGLLYSRGIQRLAAGAARPGLEPQFTLAATAAAAMRRALGELAMEDGQTEDVGWTAMAEAMLCSAASAAPGIAARLASLPTAPNGGAARRRRVLCRAVASLVNAGHYALARDVVRTERLDAPNRTAPLSDDDRDLLFSLSVLDVQTGRPTEAVTAQDGFARVRAATPPGSGLWWAALRGELQALDLAPNADRLTAIIEAALASQPTAEFARHVLPTLVNAGQYDLARRLAQSCAVGDPPCDAQLNYSERDVLFSLAVLGLQGPPDDPRQSGARFARVRGATEPGSALWWAALRGELQGLDQAGDGQGAAGLLAGIVSAHQAIEFGWPEMIRLVNTGRHDAAREVVRRSRLGVAGFARPGDAAPLTGEDRDRLFFLAVLDAQIGPDGRAMGEPANGRVRFARVRASTPTGSDLWWAALRGELQCLDLLDAQDEAAALTAALRAAHPDLAVPDDIAARIESITGEPVS